MNLSMKSSLLACVLGVSLICSPVSGYTWGSRADRNSKITLYSEDGTPVHQWVVPQSYIHVRDHVVTINQNGKKTTILIYTGWVIIEDME